MRRAAFVSGNARQRPGQSRDEMRALIVQRQTARFEQKPFEKKTSQRKARGHGLGGRILRSIAQKARKRQHALGIGRAGFTRNGSPGFRRNIDQLVGGPGRGSFGKVETEAELGEQLQFKAHHHGRDRVRVRKPVKQIFENLV